MTRNVSPWAIDSCLCRTRRSTLDRAHPQHTNPNDVHLTLRPNDGTVEAVVNVKSLDDKNSYHFSSDSQDASVYVNQNAFAVLKEVGNVPSYVATTVGQDKKTEGNATYDYLSWGIWAVGLEGDWLAREVHADSRWIAGALTPTAAIKEKTGTASYSGWVAGLIANKSGVELGQNANVRGDIELKADFSKNTMTGTLKFGHGDNIDTLPRAISAEMEGKISGRRFSGNLTADNIQSGKLNGAFYGPKAQEVGGNWMMQADKWQATGIFAGKEQPQKK